MPGPVSGPLRLWVPPVKSSVPPASTPRGALKVPSLPSCSVPLVTPILSVETTAVPTLKMPVPVVRLSRPSLRSVGSVPPLYTNAASACNVNVAPGSLRSVAPLEANTTPVPAASHCPVP